MGFNKSEVDRLLVDCGRLCCICHQRHKVQVHHIKPTEDGGTDEIDNAIPLCPNCHDEVHAKYSHGRTTKAYSENELRHHRQQTIHFVKTGTKTGSVEQNSICSISEEYIKAQHDLVFDKWTRDVQQLLRLLRMQRCGDGTYAAKQIVSQLCAYVSEFLGAVESRAVKEHGKNVFLDSKMKLIIEDYLESDLKFMVDKLNAALPLRKGGTVVTNAVQVGDATVRQLYQQFALKMFM